MKKGEEEEKTELMTMVLFSYSFLQKKISTGAGSFVYACLRRSLIVCYSFRYKYTIERILYNISTYREYRA